MSVSKETAMALAFAYRELDAAEKLLAKIADAINRRETPDIRDVFGRSHGGLQLGVPSGENSQRLFDLPWSLAKPVIEAHIANQRAIIAAMSETARIEAGTEALRQSGRQP